MRDYINIGSAPVEEQCAQVGRDNYRAMARLECRAFKEQLERKFPNGEFGIKSFPHEEYIGTIERSQLAKKFKNMSEEDFTTTSAYVLAKK